MILEAISRCCSGIERRHYTYNITAGNSLWFLWNWSNNGWGKNWNRILTSWLYEVEVVWTIAVRLSTWTTAGWIFANSSERNIRVNKRSFFTVATRKTLPFANLFAFNCLQHLRRQTSMLRRRATTLRRRNTTLRRRTSTLRRRTSMLRMRTTTLRRRTSTLRRRTSTLRRRTPRFGVRTSTLRMRTTTLRRRTSTLV